MEDTVYTASQETLHLERIGNGNRGFVCSISSRPHEVCKVMGSGHRSSGRQQKIEYLIEHSATLRKTAPSLVLPQECVFDEHGNWAGFTMFKVEGTLLEEIAHNPRVPCSTRVALAHRVCYAISQAHRSDILVGDVALGNLIWHNDFATVLVLDPDSFQVKDKIERKLYATCDMRERSPETVRNTSGKTIPLTPQGEAFLVAIAVFQMLFWGVHPLDTGANDVNASAVHVECIRAKRFPYAQSNSLFPLDCYGSRLASLFRDTFKQVDRAPLTAHYQAALYQVAQAGYATCAHCGFEYSNLSPACPNCG